MSGFLRFAVVSVALGALVLSAAGVAGAHSAHSPGYGIRLTRVSTSRSSHSGYTIRVLRAPAGSRFYTKAINGRGQIVGWLDSHGGADVQAALYAGHLRELGTPAGYADSAALGVSDMGAVLMQAWSNGKRSHRFIYEPAIGHHWQRVHTGIPGYFPQSITAIDANGDVAGSIQKPGRSATEKAAVWIPSDQHTYPRATILPSTKGSASGAGAIWSGGGRIVVSGILVNPGTANPELWSRTGTGKFRTGSDRYSLFISAIGGSPGHVYAAGSVNAGGYDGPMGQAASPITFGRAGNAATSRIVNLVDYRAYGLNVESVSWVPRHGFEAVGIAAPGSGSARSVMWQGLAGSSVKGRLLTSLLPAQSSWDFSSPAALGMNRLGSIVGTGTLRGHFAAFEMVLAPRVCGHRACY